MAEFFAPFLARFRAAVRAESPGALLFVESPIWLEFDGEVRPPVGLSAKECEGMVWAPHYYDGLTLLTKGFRDWCTIDEAQKPVCGGRRRVRAAFRPRGVPSLIGETGNPYTGIPYDLPSLIGESGIPYDLPSLIGETGIPYDLLSLIGETGIPYDLPSLIGETGIPYDLPSLIGETGIPYDLP
eukprot:gene34152-55478_t